jgi:tellurite resistance protein TerB
MAGSALIAMADGQISAEEEQKMIKFIEHHDALSVLPPQKLLKRFKIL